VTRNGLGVGMLVLLVVVLATACGQGESGSENGGESTSPCGSRSCLGPYEDS
jgi:hypothetical protein